MNIVQQGQYLCSKSIFISKTKDKSLASICQIYEIDLSN